MSKEVDRSLIQTIGTMTVRKGDLNVKTLLRTGLLEGLPVKYRKGEDELDGFIKDEGYLCGCSSCNFSIVVSALKFESHAGANSSNQNNHIFLSSGISLYALVKKLESSSVQSLQDAIEEYLGSVPVPNCSRDTVKRDTSVQSDTKVTVDFNLSSGLNIKSSLTGDGLSKNTNEGSGRESRSFTHQLRKVQDESTTTDRSSKTINKTVRFSGCESGYEFKTCRNQLPNLQDESTTTDRSSKAINKTVGFSGCESGYELKTCRNQLPNLQDEWTSNSVEDGQRKKTGALRKLALFKLENGTDLFYVSNGKEVLKGYKTENGIFCYCCNEVVSPSKFEAHAGFASRRQPYHNIFTSEGVSLEKLASLHSELDPEREPEFVPGTKAKRDKPKKSVMDLPKGFGGCTVCKGLAFETGEELFSSKSFIFCGQCERVYHVGCVGIGSQERPSPWYDWLCSDDCKEVNNHLKGCTNSSPHGNKDVKWTLLRGAWSKTTNENEAMFSRATSILRDGFGEIMAEGDDVLQAMVEGGETRKVHFGGMHCVVVSRNSEAVACGVFRVFGRELAELPLAATDKECRGNGYFRWLLDVVEELVVAMKVKALVVCVDEEKQLLWKDKFGFVRVSEKTAIRYAEDYWIVRFKKKVILEKSLVSLIDSFGR